MTVDFRGLCGGGEAGAELQQQVNCGTARLVSGNTVQVDFSSIFEASNFSPMHCAMCLRLPSRSAQYAA